MTTENAPNIINTQDTINTEDILELPLMSLREVVMFPRSVIPLFVGRSASIRAIENALANHDKKIFLIAQREPEVEKPTEADLFTLGTISRILQVLRLPDGTIKVLFEGLNRAKWQSISNLSSDDVAETFPKAVVEIVKENDINTTEASALIKATHSILEEFSKVNKKVGQDTLLSMTSLPTAGNLADVIMPFLKLDYHKKQDILELNNSIERLEKVYELLQNEIAISSMEKRIKSRVKNQMDRNQREYYLNEQIKAIHKEMGKEDDPQIELVELEQKLAQMAMPDDARLKAEKEIKKLRHIPTSSAEYTVVRNYIDWILELPWNTVKDIDIDIKKAREILDKDHYGLEKPKERILEFLAVQKLVTKIKGPILCLTGPPGVGKTSLAKSIAEATGREFVRLSLGGLRDEAEIRGHRRTYVGALPGKIIQALKRAKYNNPLFCLDEIDKMSADFRGDPSSALLEVLDPEQNFTFVDNYLDLDYDLSQVFFITTANSLHSIPLPLQDRMEIIKLSGYLETEKLHIANNYLLPKQITANGLKPENITIPKESMLEVIRTYTREAGVRNLERELATICRKTAMKLVEADDTTQTVEVLPTLLSDFLGIKKYRHGEKEENPQVGIAMGLAWTELGGEMLLVETVLMQGTGQILTTGKLGDVMTESAKAAISYIRANSNSFGLKPDFNKEIDIHIHVPEGATPKDGPSAGITLTTSLISALLGIPVRNDLAMTGEITLRGTVLPIGGLREKLLAAHRGLIKTVIIPKENEKDLADVPKEILDTLEIILAQHINDVLPKALVSNEQLYSEHTHSPLFESLRAFITEPVASTPH